VAVLTLVEIASIEVAGYLQDIQCLAN